MCVRLIGIFTFKNSKYSEVSSLQNVPVGHQSINCQVAYDQASNIHHVSLQSDRFLALMPQSTLIRTFQPLNLFFLSL